MLCIAMCRKNCCTRKIRHRTIISRHIECFSRYLDSHAHQGLLPAPSKVAPPISPKSLNGPGKQKNSLKNLNLQQFTCKNCSYQCAQLCYTIQHRTVLIGFPLILQAITIAQMMSNGGEGSPARKWSRHGTHRGLQNEAVQLWLSTNVR